MKWRYHVYRDGIETMNSAWWDLKLRYQGLVPPIVRTEKHLDPAAKRHIIADLPYTRYYVSLLLEFQIHEGLCLAAGQSGQLHLCDIYRSREVGRMLRLVCEAILWLRINYVKIILAILTPASYHIRTQQIFSTT